MQSSQLSVCICSKLATFFKSGSRRATDVFAFATELQQSDRVRPPTLLRAFSKTSHTIFANEQRETFECINSKKCLFSVFPYALYQACSLRLLFIYIFPVTFNACEKYTSKLAAPRDCPMKCWKNMDYVEPPAGRCAISTTFKEK